MRKYSIIPRVFVLSLVLASLFPAKAANTTLFWDQNGATAGTGGSGAWDTSSSIWRSGSATGALQTYTNTSPSTITADFAGTAGTVTIASGLTINVNAIIFGTTGYTIAGTDATSFLNLDGTTPTITTGAGLTQTISATITGTAGLTKSSDTGVLVLSGTNIYTGNTSILGGTVSIKAIGGTGVASSGLGAGTSTINIGTTTAGGLTYTGNGETTDRVINLSGTTTGATITQSGTAGLLKFTSDFTATGSGAKTLTLAGAAAGAGEISGRIVDSSGGATTVTKSGTGTWTLSGANTYTGGVNINAGVLRVNVAENAGTNGALGASGTIAFGGGTLQYSSANTFDYSSRFATTAQNIIIDTNGQTVTFGTALMSGVSGSLTLNDTNATTGRLTLTAANSYTGATTISSGTLQMGIANALPAGTSLTLGSTGRSGVLDLGSGASSFNQTIAGLGTAGTAGSQTITNSDSTGAAHTATLTVNNDTTTSNADFTYGGVIQNGASGAKVALVKSGDKTLTLSGANTFTGGISIQGGRLAAGNNVNALGDNTNVVTLGAVSGGADVSLTGANSLTFAQAIVVASGTGKRTIGSTSNSSAVVFGGSITLNNDLTFTTFGTGGSITASGVISGTGNVIAANTSGGTASLSGTINNQGLIMNTSAGAGGLTIGGVIGSNVTGVVQNSAASTLSIGGNNTSFSTGVTIISGTLSATSVNALGTGTVLLGGTTGSGNATLIGSTLTFANAITVQAGNSGTATLGNGGSGPTYSGLITLNKDLTVAAFAASNTLTMSGAVSGAAVTGTNNLIAGGAGTVVLSGSNPGFTGNVLVNSGTFKVGSAAALSSANTVAVDSLSSATFNINNIDQTIAGLNNGTNGGGTVSNTGAAAHTLTLAGNGVYSFGGSITGTGAGANMALAVALSGGGKQTLTGSNTYTGATSVLRGTLAVNGSLGNTTVTVGNSGTSALTPTLMGGSGTSTGGSLFTPGNSPSRQVYSSSATVGNITGNVIISGTSASGSAGHLAPGNGVGTLTVGALTLSGGSILDYEFNGSANDFTVVAGALTLNSGTAGINLYQEGGTSQFATAGTYDLFQYGSLSGSVSNLAVLNSNAGFTYAFGTTSSGTSNYVTLTITTSGSSATSTSYTLAASAGSTNILTGGTTGITSTITNTGSGSADTLNYTGLGASSGAGGSVSGSTTSGTGLAQGASGTNAGQVFTGTQSGAVVVTPVGSGTNGTLGTTATATGTTSVTVNVFDPASLSGAQSGTGTVVALTALNQSGTFRASAKVTADNGLSNNQGFTDVAVAPGTQIDPGNSVTVASFDKTNRLNGTYTATKGLGYDNVTSSGSAITGGNGNTANIGLSVTVSGQTAGAGQAFNATLFSGQKYGTTTGSTSSGYGLTSNIAVDPHSGTTATLINGIASANTTVSMSFNTVPSAGAIHDTTFRTSDILSLGGIVATGTLGPDNSILTDKYVLQLSYDPSAAGAQYIGWYDAVQSQWVNAIAGNSAGGHYDGSGEFFGSYADYLATLTGPQQADLAFQLNAFGYDVSTHTAWAVLDHNSEFAVIPEPGTWGMILSGFGMLIGIQRLRRRRVGT